MSEEPYVKISTSTEGYALVEVLNKDSTNAIASYFSTIQQLTDGGYKVAVPNELETKISNENTKFIKTVTVKGRGEQVGHAWLNEIHKSEVLKE
jgi:hypothetical protein